MDAIGHAVITTAVSKDSLAIVASAINLRYRMAGLHQLRKTLPSTYLGLHEGIKSHILANRLLYRNEKFKAMRKQANSVLALYGIPRHFGEAAMEATIDYILLQNENTRQWANAVWNQFDWEATSNYTPQFSREPERARNNITYVQERLNYLNIEHTADWLRRVVISITKKPEQELTKYLGAIHTLANQLEGELLYREVIEETKEKMQLAFT